MTQNQLKNVFLNHLPVKFYHQRTKLGEALTLRRIIEITFRRINNDCFRQDCILEDFNRRSFYHAELKYVEPIDNNAEEHDIDNLINAELWKAFKKGQAVVIGQSKEYPCIDAIKLTSDEKGKSNVYCLFNLNGETRYYNALEVSVKTRVKAINYKAIFALFKELCPSLPQPTKLTEARKKAIKAAVADETDFGMLFRKVQTSDFLIKKCKACRFDWILKPANRAKILEGNYDDAPIPAAEKASYDIEELEKIV